MNDFLTDGDELTPEELEALGRTPEEPEPEESGIESEEEKTEEEIETEEDDSEESEGDDVTDDDDLDDGEPIPYKRFSKVNGQRKDLERENEKLRLELEEKTKNKEEVKPQEKESELKNQTNDIGAMKLDDPDSDYHGKTLNEIYEDNPAFATKLQSDYYEAQRLEAQKAEKEKADAIAYDAKYADDLRRELSDFETTEAKRLYDKDVDVLSKKERADVDAVMQNVLDYMNEHAGRFSTMEDAYVVMNHTDEGRKKAFKNIKGKIKAFEGAPSNMESSGGSSESSAEGYSLDLTRQQVGDMIAAMSDNKYVAWKNKAPKTFLKKFDLLR